MPGDDPGELQAGQEDRIKLHRTSWEPRLSRPCRDAGCEPTVANVCRDNRPAISRRTAISSRHDVSFQFYRFGRRNVRYLSRRRRARSGNLTNR